MRSPNFILRAGVGLGLFVGMCATIAKAWMLPESATGERWALIALTFVLILGVQLILPERAVNGTVNGGAASISTR